MNKKLRNDILLFAAVLLVGALTLAGIYIFSADGRFVTVTVDGEIYGRYSLAEPRRIELDGNTVVIDNGQVYMESADCPDKLCVLHRAISKSGQTIICLPNRVVVRVEGGADAVTR